MERHEKAPVVEAILFASDEPMTIPALRKVIEDLTAGEARDILETLKADYEAEERGITLVEIAGGFIFCTKESCAPWVEKMMKGKRRVRLSRAALETVAVIAYKQPIGRNEIERIRGVEAGGVLSTLLERDLIMIKGRDTGPGKPLLYGTTQEFLNYFGLNRITDLPRLDELTVLAAKTPEWTEAERARMEKAGLDPIELEGHQPADLAHAGEEEAEGEDGGRFPAVTDSDTSATAETGLEDAAQDEEETPVPLSGADQGDPARNG
jgi:segregation and condensation protein B